MKSGPPQNSPCSWVEPFPKPFFKMNPPLYRGIFKGE
nr:MAG TPA: hypothetical protein [Bacteriophage sp.]